MQGLGGVRATTVFHPRLSRQGIGIVNRHHGYRSAPSKPMANHENSQEKYRRNADFAPKIYVKRPDRRIASGLISNSYRKSTDHAHYELR